MYIDKIIKWQQQRTFKIIIMRISAGIYNEYIKLFEVHCKFSFENTYTVRTMHCHKFKPDCLQVHYRHAVLYYST